MAEVNPPQAIAIEFEVGEPLVLIYIARTLAQGRDVYEAVRRVWRINLNNVVKRDGSYKLVLARDKTTIVGAYRPAEWYHDPEIIGRKAFHGHPAEQPIWERYVGYKVPEKFMRPGARNPIRYLNPED